MNQNKARLQVNFNKINQLTSTRDEQQPLIERLKPALNVMASFGGGDENLISFNKDLKNAKQKDGLQRADEKRKDPSPKEPSPPKLRSYTRNSFRQNLKASVALAPKNPNLIDLDTQPQDKQPVQPTKETVNKRPLLTIAESKQQRQEEQEQRENSKQQQQQQQQEQHESIISRIPRLSFRFPIAMQGQQQFSMPLQQKRTGSNGTKPLSNCRQANRDVEVAETKRTDAIVAEQDDEDDEDDTEIEDIDKSSGSDAIYYLSDVAKDVYQYMFDLEEQQSVREDYLRDQKILTPKVRQRLVNWCIEIHHKLKLLPETLYMTIAIIDRFFDQTPAKQQSQVQLVAVGATLIASKYEEIYPPELHDLIMLSHNSYTSREILRVEIHILEQLKFNLGKPIPLAFLRRFSRAANCDLKMHSLAKFIMELSLSEYECSHWRPSLLAAASLYTSIHLIHHDQSGTSKSSSSTSSSSSLFGSRLISGGLAKRMAAARSNAAHMKRRERWNKTLVHYTHYAKKDLQGPSAVLCQILKRAQKNPQLFYCVKKNTAQWNELLMPKYQGALAKAASFT